MNNQMPYNFMPPPNFGPPGNQCNCTAEVRRLNERIDRLERQIKMLERRINSFDPGPHPMPRPMQYGEINSYSDNYMI